VKRRDTSSSRHKKNFALQRSKDKIWSNGERRPAKVNECTTPTSRYPSFRLSSVVEPQAIERNPPRPRLSSTSFPWTALTLKCSLLELPSLSHYPNLAASNLPHHGSSTPNPLHHPPPLPPTRHSPLSQTYLNPTPTSTMQKSSNVHLPHARRLPLHPSHSHRQVFSRLHPKRLRHVCSLPKIQRPPQQDLPGRA
jgi:hypothetical protein